MSGMDLVRLVLEAASGNQLVADDAAAGIALLMGASAEAAPTAAWHEAVANAVARGLVYDPVRLLPGALKCHWRLELTLAGHAEAMRLLA